MFVNAAVPFLRKAFDVNTSAIFCQRSVIRNNTETAAISRLPKNVCAQTKRQVQSYFPLCVFTRCLSPRLI